MEAIHAWLFLGLLLGILAGLFMGLGIGMAIGLLIRMSTPVYLQENAYRQQLADSETEFAEDQEDRRRDFLQRKAHRAVQSGRLTERKIS